MDSRQERFEPQRRKDGGAAASLCLRSALMDHALVETTCRWDANHCLRYLADLDHFLSSSHRAQRFATRSPCVIAYRDWLEFATKHSRKTELMKDVNDAVALWGTFATIAIAETLYLLPLPQTAHTEHTPNHAVSEVFETPKSHEAANQSRPPLNPFDVLIDFRHFALLLFLQTRRSTAAARNHLYQRFLRASYEAGYAHSRVGSMAGRPAGRSNASATGLAPAGLTGTAYLTMDEELCNYVATHLNLLLRIVHRHYLSDISVVSLSALNMLNIVFDTKAKHITISDLFKRLTKEELSSTTLLWSPTVIQGYLMDAVVSSKPKNNNIRATSESLKTEKDARAQSRKSTSVPPLSVQPIQSPAIEKLFCRSPRGPVGSSNIVEETSTTLKFEGWKRETLFRRAKSVAASDENASLLSAELAELTECHVYILKPLQHVKVQRCKDTRVVLPAVAGVVSVSACSGLELIAAGRCFKISNCYETRLFLYTASPIILSGDTRGTVIGPYNALLSDQNKLMAVVNLQWSERYAACWAHPLVLGGGATTQLTKHVGGSRNLHSFVQLAKTGPSVSGVVEAGTTTSPTSFTGTLKETCEAALPSNSRHQTPGVVPREGSPTWASAASSVGLVYTPLNPSDFAVFLVPEPRLLRRSESADLQPTRTANGNNAVSQPQLHVVLPKTYAEAYQKRQAQVVRAAQQLAQLGVSNPQVPQQIQKHFVEWLQNTGKLRELLDIGKLDLRLMDQRQKIHTMPGKTIPKSQ